MRILSMVCVLACLVMGSVSLARAEDRSPRARCWRPSFNKSQVFPGTIRDYWVYIPKQYTAEKPACVYINQDGIGYNAPAVFDQLIAKGEMPVTIGVFVMHGKVLAPNGEALDRFNRSFEYDGLGDGYALLEELLPDVDEDRHRRAGDQALEVGQRPLHRRGQQRGDLLSQQPGNVRRSSRGCSVSSGRT